jgi:hypothetical protein
MNIKNEIRYINAVSEASNNELNECMKIQLNQLFEDKKEYMKEILLLKSAFSVIDQMFHQEIENAQKMKNRWFYNWCFHYEKIPNPLSLNPFIEALMDPFKDCSSEQVKLLENIKISNLKNIGKTVE